MAAGTQFMLSSYAPGGFVPTSIAGCKLWAAGNLLSLSNNDPVSSWTDFSGNSNSPTQGTGAAQPTFKTNILNGLAIVRFDGGDYLTKAWTLGPPSTAFIVVKSAFDATDCLDGGSLNQSVFQRASSTSALAFDGAALFATVGNWSNFNYYCIVWNGASSLIGVNGTETTGILGTGGYNTGVAIGAGGDGTNAITGDIAEVIIYDTALSIGNRGAANTYLASKYAL